MDGPATLHDERKRRLSAHVLRFVRRRSRDRCEYPGCRNEVFLQYAHIVPHCKGGNRSAMNIVLLCTEHHFQLDAGLIRFLGWGRDGLGRVAPVFEDPMGIRRGGDFTGEVPSRARPPDGGGTGNRGPPA